MAHSSNVMRRRRSSSSEHRVIARAQSRTAAWNELLWLSAEDGGGVLPTMKYSRSVGITQHSRMTDGWTSRPELAKRFEIIGHARNWARKTMGDGERESWNVYYSTFDVTVR